MKPGTRVYCDNLFTSMDLLDHMSEKGVGVVGTMRQNRINNIPLPNKKEGGKMERGDYKVVYEGEDKNIIIWKDSAPVYVASNCAGVEPVGQCKRYSSKDKKKVEVDIPRAILDYNAGMGGVDLLDAMVSCYAIRTRSKKWYWPLYNWYLNVSMVQAWRLYRKVGKVLKIKNQDKIPLLDFVRDCVEMSIKVPWRGQARHHPAPRSLSHQPQSHQEG